MSEPIESVIIRAQENFDVVGGLNLIQIEINDDTVIKILKNYKNIVYKIISLGLLFPASIKNDTRQIFVLAKKLNRVKKCILTYKYYDILAAIGDQSKIGVIASLVAPVLEAAAKPIIKKIFGGRKRSHRKIKRCLKKQ